MITQTIISDHVEAIQVLGDTCHLARLFGVTPSAIAQWKSRGIPYPRRAEIKRQLEAKGYLVPLDWHETRGGRRHAGDQ